MAYVDDLIIMSYMNGTVQKTTDLLSFKFNQKI